MENVIDTSRTLTINALVRKYVLGLIISSALVCACLVMRLYADVHMIQGRLFVLTILSALGVPIFLWLLLFRRGPVFIFSPEGILVPRLSSEVIAWGAFQKITIWQFNSGKLGGVKFILLHLNAGVENSLLLTRSGKRSMRYFQKQNINAISIGSDSVSLSFNELHRICLAYHFAALHK